MIHASAPNTFLNTHKIILLLPGLAGARRSRVSCAPSGPYFFQESRD